MKMKKIVALLLAVCLVASLAACAPANKDDNNKPVTYVDPYAQYADDYDELCQAVYDDVLGDFYTAYTAAKAEKNVAKKHAMMAIAEAKMLAAGIFLPTTSQGGNYAMTAIAPYTNTPVLWGNDTYRFHDRIVVTEPIKAEDYKAMKAEWQNKIGTPEADYEAYVKDFLAQKGYTVKNTLNVYFDADPETWDVLATSNAADSEILVQTYDGLYEYDMENKLQPALAESYTVSDDGLVYTFKIRQGVKWVNNQGVAVADVKADDFVAGMQHMMDTMGGLEYLVDGLIVGAHEYIAAETRDFTTVGVKAVDDYTLQYTLTAPASYFMTMLGYGVFAPLSRSYYESMGGKFGADFDSAAETYTYGKGPDSIAYCGPFVITGFTSNNSIVCDENAAYWNKGNNNITKLTYYYTDGSDEQGMYNDFTSGKIDGLGLTEARMEMAKKDGKFDTYAYIADTDATTYCGFFNVRRSAFANFNDANVGKTAKTEEEQVRTGAAMLNKNFRLALAMSMDRGNYNAQAVGEDLKLTSLCNSYTPGNFVQLAEEVTVSINGTDKTYPMGTQYGQIIQDQLDADNVGLKVWDGNASSGFDGWYNPTKAVEYLNKAIEELKAVGIEITAENPIKLDLPVRTDYQVSMKQKQALKQSVETVTGGKIVISLVEYSTRDDYLNATYWYGAGSEANFDLNDGSGWGPDYGDPQTYLDTMLPAYAGYMTKSLGLF
ncbi:MAG: peptide ABC transporter substrate-binding protein [Oscillospiraceae bacterium]|nr:peptide ABC transporter substrate-binding protein [Oscillospiraceae bacterium]